MYESSSFLNIPWSCTDGTASGERLQCMTTLHAKLFLLLYVFPVCWSSLSVLLSLLENFYKSTYVEFTCICACATIHPQNLPFVLCFCPPFIITVSASLLFFILWQLFGCCRMIRVHSTRFVHMCCMIGHFLFVTCLKLICAVRCSKCLTS